jgi:dolichol-phosphate mannosyltransferase
VDDGSTDRSMAILADEAAKDGAVKVLALSRNFGHQIAITAGLDHASGDAVVTMDADLQDPPELISDLAARWREGCDVVYARRRARHGEGLLKRASASVFYRLLGRVASVDIPRDTGDFRLMSRRAVQALRAMRERHRFVRGMSAWIGFTQGSVPFDRAPRAAGETKYGLGKMLRLAADAVVAFSWVPLRLALYVGVAACGLCGTVVFVSSLMWAFTDRVLPGWMSLTVLIVFLGAVQLLTVGIMGEYVGRILDEVKARPLYFLRSTINLAARGEGEGGSPGQ